MSGRIVGSLAIIAVATAAANVHFSNEQLENAYANGFFAAANRTLVPLSNGAPFALIDLLVAITLALVIAIAWRTARSPRASRPVRFVAIVAQIAAIAAVEYAWFMVAWGYNYRRDPLIVRVAYREENVTPQAVARFADRITAILNTDVGAAHDRAHEVTDGTMQRTLADDFLPVAARVGDRWQIALTRPKHTLADRVFSMAGIGGLYNPLGFETVINGTFLPFEIPRALAHEWSHAAGFTDEGDANALGTLACLRSADPLIRYSGAFWTFGELPQTEQRRVRLDPRVLADFKAAQARFLRFYEPRLFAISWHVYDSYLKANGVRAGVVSYSQFVRLLVGTPLGADGLPQVRTQASAGLNRRAFSRKILAFTASPRPRASNPSRSRPYA